LIIVNQVLILVFLILAGVTARKLNLVSEYVKDEVSSLVINITMPLFIISTMSSQKFSGEMLINSGILIAIAASTYVVFILFSKVVSRALGVEGSVRDIFEYVLVFANVGYMGYPVLNLAFGSTGVFYGAVFNIIFDLLVWTYGVWILTRSTGDGNRKKFVMNSALIAVVVGFSMFALGIKLPYPVAKTVEMIGNITTPLSMMFIGFILSEIHFKEFLTEWKSVVLSAFRLLVIPLITMTVLKVLGFKGMMVGVPTVLMAMPASANTAILAARFRSDYKLASKVVFVSTFFSVITIPLILGIIGI
jgi:malate permease and related proteins